MKTTASVRLASHGICLLEKIDIFCDTNCKSGFVVWIAWFWSGITGIKVHHDSQWNWASRNLWQTSLQFFLIGWWKRTSVWKEYENEIKQTLYFMTLGKMDWVSDIAYENSNQLNISRDFILRYLIWLSVYLNNVERDFHRRHYTKYKIQLPVAKDTISLAKYYTT